MGARSMAMSPFSNKAQGSEAKRGEGGGRAKKKSGAEQRSKQEIESGRVTMRVNCAPHASDFDNAGGFELR
jgi:hypothetical protein